MENISGLAAEIVVAFVIALATGAFTFMGFWRQAKADLEQEYLKRFNDKKWGVYTEFAKLLQAPPQDIFEDGRRQAAETAIASQIVLIGSDEVVRAFRDWRESMAVHGRAQRVTDEKLFLLVANMRRDLGIKYSNLEVDDLLGVLNPSMGGG